MSEIKDIKFHDFNSNRYARGADAARYLIEYHDGESEFLWMSVKDIKNNIKIFPEFTQECNKGLLAYGKL